jgi:hypothetical protein
MRYAYATYSGADFKETKRRRWDLEHGFFAVMRGFRVSVKNDDKWILDDGSTVTPRGILELAKMDMLPDVDKETIGGRSKADGLAKTVVVVQAMWMLLQTVGRKASGLPITLLELNTLAHVGCALALYIIWWKKPQDLTEPIEITIDPLLASYMSSRRFRPCFKSAHDAIGHARCADLAASENERNPVDRARSRAWETVLPPNISGHLVVGSVDAVFPWHHNKKSWPDVEDKIEIRTISNPDAVVMLLPGQWLSGLPITPVSYPQHLTLNDIQRLELWSKLLDLPERGWCTQGVQLFPRDARLTWEAPQDRIQGNLS